MTEQERAELKEFVKKCKDYLNETPDGILKEEPRFVFSGEIIPESLRKARRDKLYSDKS